MNAKLIAVVLLVASLGLGIGLYLSVDKAREDRDVAASRLNTLSNQLVSTTMQLSDEKKESSVLKTNLAQKIEETGIYSNKISFVAAELSRTEQEAREAAAKSRAELEKRDRQIAGLETEKDGLTKQMAVLTGRITGLDGKIKDTERRLASSEGDREALRKELRRLVAEKTELEHKFQDLAVLREQVRTLKEDLAIANRLEFIRKGLYGFDRKGAQLLQEGFRKPEPAGTNAAVGNQLNVEVRSDGRPATVRTNAPAAR
ncbi:MAG: hypothetical protein DVB31_05965 [Verrucomicrobia bacterium]|nr:MAG: hypothetical protein DVB31_05965 [Verrucomicrobiota bacterium]